MVLNTIHVYESYTIVTRINEFFNVRALKIICFSKHGLTYYNSIIDNCVEPSTIIAYMNTYNYIKIEEVFPDIFHPRNGIYKLDCYWNALYSDIQLNYIMQKFPKLQDLTIALHPRGDKYSIISTEMVASLLQ